MCVPFLTKILCSTLMYDYLLQTLHIYNLAHVVTIMNSTSKGQMDVRELAYLQKNHLWWERVLFTRGERRC